MMEARLYNGIWYAILESPGTAYSGIVSLTEIECIAKGESIMDLRWFMYIEPKYILRT